MRINARWRRALLRLGWSVPLAFAVVSAFAFTGILNCYTDPIIQLPPTGGGCGSSCQEPTWTIYRSQTAETWTMQSEEHGDHYGIHLTTTAHATDSDGITVLFETRNWSARLQEFCYLTPMQTDFNATAQISQSPETDEPSGGYSAGGCTQGQAIFWDWGFQWYNLTPSVPADTSGDGACLVLHKPLQGDIAC